MGQPRPRLLLLGRLGHRRAHAGALGALAALTAVAAACRGDALDVVVPEFAVTMPGRSCIVAWGDDPLPDALEVLLRGLDGALGLTRRDSDEATVLLSPESLEVGWSSLAGSHVFRTALRRLDPAASHHLFVDLEQLVEVAAVELPGRLRERVVRGLALRGLRCVLLSLRREEGEWRGDGVILTSGTRAGLPGLLTRETEVTSHAPAVDPRRGMQVELAFEPRALQRLVTSLTLTDEPSLFAGIGESVGLQLDQLVRTLGGRASFAGSIDGDAWAAVRVADEAALEAMLEALPAGLVEDVPCEVRDGWLVVRNDEGIEWRPPAGPAETPGPFLWVSLGLPLGSRLTVWLRRGDRDVIEIDVRM